MEIVKTMVEEVVVAGVVEDPAVDLEVGTEEGEEVLLDQGHAHHGVVRARHAVVVAAHPPQRGPPKDPLAQGIPGVDLAQEVEVEAGPDHDLQNMVKSEEVIETRKCSRWALFCISYILIEDSILGCMVLRNVFAQTDISVI